ncbi:MAG: phage holin family protein [Anaerolineales bacterium]|jgi:putative membrane protein|nr:phage holin family protein [Anaerolineales bacterium]
MNKFLIRLLINAVALYAAVSLVAGIQVLPGTGWISYLGLAFIFGLLNALVRPVLKFLTCPLIILTLGLFTLVINTLMFWLTGLIGLYFKVGFTVDSFWAALLGGIIVSIVSVVLTAFFKDDKR